MKASCFRGGPVAPLVALGGLTILVVVLAQQCVSRPMPVEPIESPPAVAAPPR